jgi:hypothetical protein
LRGRVLVTLAEPSPIFRFKLLKASLPHWKIDPKFERTNIDQIFNSYRFQLHIHGRRFCDLTA